MNILQKEVIQPEAVPLRMIPNRTGWYEVKLSTLAEQTPQHFHLFREGDILFISDGFVSNLSFGFTESLDETLKQKSGIIDVVPLSGVKLTIELRAMLGSVHTYKDHEQAPR